MKVGLGLKKGYFTCWVRVGNMILDRTRGVGQSPEEGLEEVVLAYSRTWAMACNEAPSSVLSEEVGEKLGYG